MTTRRVATRSRRAVAASVCHAAHASATPLLLRARASALTHCIVGGGGALVVWGLRDGSGMRGGFSRMGTRSNAGSRHVPSLPVGFTFSAVVLRV